jgi:hypothetical protein
MCLTQKITRVNKLLSGVAKVAELVDAQASGACVRKDVGVRVPPFAQLLIPYIFSNKFMLSFTVSRFCQFRVYRAGNKK